MHKLKKVYIEITNHCNLSCSFCKKTSRPKGFITPVQFGVILKKIKPHTDYVYLHVLGEPLLHKGLGHLLDLCNDSGVKASLTTNATLIPAQKENIINKNALRQINYSLHSIFENGKNYKEIMTGIFDLITATGNSVYHCLRLWNFASDDEYKNAVIMEEIADFFKTDVILKTITKGHGIKIADNVFIQQQERFVWPGIGAEEIFTSGKCGALKHDVGILVDGSVVACCLDGEGDIVLGNIYEQELEEILKSPRAESIRTGFSKKEVREKLCRTCGFAVRLNQ